MQVNIKNSGTYATIRMTQEEYKELRVYMHTEEHKQISFPYGAFIATRGRGWYRITSANFKRVVDKIQFAVRTVRQFIKERLIEIAKTSRMTNRGLKAVAYSSKTHSSGDWTHIIPSLPPTRASETQLLQLAARFSKQASK